MDIYLIRHAHAVALGEHGVENDEDRPLSEQGMEQSRRLAATLEQHRVEVDAILTTPLLRARRTAEILLENSHQPTPPDLIVEDRLTPECKPRKLTRVLRELARDRVAIVGHQPDIGVWAAWLIGSKKAYINFAKAGAAHIVWESELKKGGGALMWLITPEWFENQAANTPRLVAAD